MRASYLAAVVLCLLAGCASQSHPTDLPAASPASVSSPLASSSAESSAPATAESNRQQADEEAARLLAMAQVPPGATPLASPPADLSGPALGTPATSSLIDHARYWQVPMSFASALAWVKAHPPVGLTSVGSTSGSGPGEQSGGYSYTASDSPPSSGGELEIGVASVSADASDIRADGVAEWLDPVPLRDDATGPRMRVTVAGGCPETDANEVGVSNINGAYLNTELLPTAPPTSGLSCEYGDLNGNQSGLITSTTLNSTAAAQLASAVTSSSLGHLDNAMTNCPADFGSVTVLVLSYTGRTDVDLWYARTGCQWLSNGYIEASPSDALDELVNPAASGPPAPAASS
jgi:hypothetical protein